MKNNILTALFGFLFALGLGLSGMTQTEKVIGFLDIFGAWDPSLLFVMMGAIGVHAPLYRLIRKRQSPLFSSRWYLSEKTNITPSLVLGAFIFGIGWGIAGYCPGPAVVSLATLQLQPALFMVGLIGGLFLYRQRSS